MNEKRKHSKPEINSGEVLVERAGYVSRERRIKNIIRAGIRLDQLRKSGYYDIPEGQEVDIDNVYYDPTREKNFDMADASMLKKQIHKKLKEANYVKDTKNERVDKKQVEVRDDKIQDEPKP